MNDQPTGDGQPLLQVENLVKHYPARRGPLGRRERVRAVDDISLHIDPGETLGLVGESGCGKSTVGKCIMRFVEPTSGRIRYAGKDVTHWSKRRLRSVRNGVQVVFQDPHASLNPRMSMFEVVAEPLRVHGLPGPSIERQVLGLLDRVGLDARLRDRFPHEFSGGQRQRIAIARALTLHPKALVLDEPVSSLDVSVQAQVLGLLQELQDELGLAYLFISHDLSVVHHLSDRVTVMYLGRVVETGSRRQVFRDPRHPYTRSLLSAVPIADPAARGRRDRIILHGDVPNPASPPSGCRFRTRCWKAKEICATTTPELHAHGRGEQLASCHFPEYPDSRSGKEETSPHATQ